ncbi:MAG TPA: 3'-5' exonuclease [Hyphomicrobiaceae bacterium]|nr:3'-5' exonuclease [Hyphomicrobiaceae bacterium]
MAQMIPDALPACCTAGEKRVFAALGRLPDDCLVYYEPVVRRRYPDFIAILPDVGTLVIEVKGWRLGELSNISPDRVTVAGLGAAKHPLEQARQYKFRLMDECRKHPRAGALLRDEGPNAGGFIFPFCHIALLSNISRSQIEREAPDLMRLFPPGITITRDELAEWETLDPQALLARLKACFDPAWPFPKLTPAQIDVLRSVIHPQIIIRTSETDLAVLDLRQERNARDIGAGHRIVYGVAGSGKTVLLIARAKMLAEDPDRRCLVLCYNQLLAQYLAGALAGQPAVTAMTLHSWAGRCGVEFSKDEDGDAFGERLLARLRSDASLCGRYDAVLIDEAQDWPCSWFQCAKLALKEPETGDLLIVGDGNQALFGRRDFTWADAGINAAGRVINRKLDLDRNYRNTAEILRAARPFAVQPGRGRRSVLAPLVDPDTAIRSGPEPLLVCLGDAASEMRYAATLIESWLLGGLGIRGHRQRVEPGDIAVLYPRRHPHAEVNVKALCERLSGFTRAVLLAGDKAKGALRDNSVKIMPMPGARGLQFRIVVLLWTHLLPSTFKDRDDGIERALLYVAMTRAEDMLVILHSGSSPYVDEIYRALGREAPSSV